MEKPAMGPQKGAICVGRTQSVEEANRVAQQYELQGFETWITRASQGGITLFEVWASKEPQILTGKGID